MKVSPPASQLARRVYLHTLGSAYQPDQRSLGQHFPAADTGTLWDMFHPADFAGHTTFSILRVDSTVLEIQILTPVITTLAFVLDNGNILVGVIL